MTTPTTTQDRTRPGLVVLVVLLGVVLRLPSLTLGFYADDYLHQFALDGDLPIQPWSLFDFGEVADWSGVEGTGSFPWWTSPSWKARFLRPLASLSTWLDHAVYGREALGYHATSLALYALLAASVHALYRALGLSARASLGALLLFVCSSESALPVAWIANRNSLLAVLFTVLATLAVTRWRSWGGGPAALVALACAALALLSKESGAAALPVVAACAWREARVTRVNGTDPASPGLGHWAALVTGACAALAAAYGTLYLAGGYGTNSLFYSTPWTQPAAYAERLGELLATCGLALATPVSTDVLTVMPELELPFLVVATPIGLGLAVWTWRATRGAPAAGLLALWVLVSLLPQASAQLSDRLMMGASVGSSALLALLVASAFRSGRRAWSPSRVGAGLLLLLAGPLSALAVPFTILAIGAMAEDVRATARTADVGPPELGHREVFVLQARNAFVPFVLHTTYAFECADRDLTFHPLQAGRRGLVWTREDERTCTFEVLGERRFLDDPFEYVYRSEELDAAPGTTWDEGTFTVESVAADERGLSKIRVRFAESLDTPRYRFLVHRDERLTAIPPPAIGETVRIEEVAGPPF